MIINKLNSNVIWKNSWKDVFLVSILIAKVTLIVLFLYLAEGISFFYAPIVWIFFGLYFYYDVIVINHEFSHTPFFTAQFANRAFRVLNSTALYYPMSIIEESHRLHHVYGNDSVDENGETGDPLSTYKNGVNGNQENFLTYSLLSFFRGNKPSELYHGVSKRIPKWLISLEIISIVAFISLSLSLNWKWFLIGITPSIYIGWVLSDMQNYFEHYFATNKNDKLTDSVSNYGKLYNFLTFNQGYHQEHHFRPSCHWSKRVELKQQFIDNKVSYYVAKYPPILGFMEKP